MIEDSSEKQPAAWAAICAPSRVQREGRERSHVKCMHSIPLRMIAPAYYTVQLSNNLDYAHPEVR